jgi:hypothetical protein
MQVSGCRSDDLLETMCRGGVTDDPRRAIYDKHNAAGGKRLVPSGHIVSRIKHQGKNQVQNKEVEKEAGKTTYSAKRRGRASRLGRKVY